MKFWRVTGVFFLIGVEALTYGYSYPFFTLALENRELANWLIGLNASLAGAGALLIGPLLPHLIDNFGIRRLVAGFSVMSLLSFVSILLLDSMAVWFLARFVMGACFAALWTTSEIWLIGVVDDHRRGRVIAVSGPFYATFQFFGALVVGSIGVTGSLPLIVAMVPLALGMAVALFASSPGAETEPGGRPREATSLKRAFALAGGLMATAFVCGIGKFVMLSLLPIYGLAHGLNDGDAVRLVAAFILGEAVLVVALSWMADRYGRYLILKFCALAATITTGLLPFSIGSAAMLWPVLFFAGGSIAGLSALGIHVIRQDFRAGTLAVVRSSFLTAFSAGAVAGPVSVGALIDLFGPDALPISIAVAFLGLAIILFLGNQEYQHRVEDSAPTLPSLTYLEDSSFDEDEPTYEPAPMMQSGSEPKSFVQPDPGIFKLQKTMPPVQSSPERASEHRNEIDLTETFRQRAARIAERLAERK